MWMECSVFCQKSDSYKCWVHLFHAAADRLVEKKPRRFNRCWDHPYEVCECEQREMDEARWKKAEARKRRKAVAREKEVAHVERGAQEEAAAEEACLRIAQLPQEIKIYILHFLRPRLIRKLRLPVPLLRSVLQAEEPNGTKELVENTWCHRLPSNKDKFALFKLARKASLCSEVKPSFLLPIFNGGEIVRRRRRRVDRSEDDSDDSDDQFFETLYYKFLFSGARY